MSKKKKKPQWLGRGIAMPAPYLTLCLNKKEFNKVISKLTKQEVLFPVTGALCTTVTRPGTTDVCAVISVSKQAQQQPFVEVHGLLVHEAVHVWQAYAESISEDAPAIEQEAYAIQCISQELFAEYARRTQ